MRASNRPGNTPRRPGRRASPAQRVTGAGLFAVIVALAALPALPACSAFSSEEPPVADSTMVEVLVDLHLLDARAEVDLGDVPAVQRDSVLGAHSLDPARFEAALHYYADHPETYANIYAQVVDRLTTERPVSPEP